MTFTIEQLETAAEEINSGTAYGDVWSDVKYGDADQLRDKLGAKSLTQVDGYGGEGEGDDLWVVFDVDGQLFRKSGYWVSHDGCYWDGALEEVEPYEVTVTRYREVKR